MDIRKKKKGLTASVIIALICCITTLLVFLTSNAISDKNSGYKLVLEPTSTATLNSTYGALHDDSSYRYTDYRKIEQMHSGKISDDTTSITVDSAQRHGSQENPYVIDSEARWNAFAADMGNTTSGITDFGADDYFVLSKDLDFNGKTLSPVARFDGTFYGLGHTVSNVSLDCASAHNGLFRILYSGTITDFNSLDYNFTNIGGNVGGIIAYIHTGHVLNCHTEGVMSRTSKTTEQICFGGISGGSHRLTTIATNPVFYRCSAKINVSGIDTSEDTLSGGIVGIVWRTTSISILDCHAEMTVNKTTVGIPFYYGSITGIIAECSNTRIENCTGKFLPTQTTSSTNGLFTGIATVYSDKVVCTAANSFNIKISNVYVQAESDVSTTFYPFLSWNTKVANLDSTLSTNISNVQYAGRYSMHSLTGGSTDKYINGSCTKVSDLNTLWSDAKATSSPLTNAIWDKTKINTAYSIENSPVINKLEKSQFNVEFMNYKTSGDVGLGVSDINYDSGSALTLPTPSAPDANHTFVGWTTDKTGESAPFTAMPANMYGDLTLYAVWDNPNTTADITLSNSYTSNSTDTIEYGTGEITLTATSDGKGMSSPTKTFKWYKDSSSTAVETGNTCTLKNVKQTGSYSLEYTLQDKVEPLWRHAGKLSKTQSVTITKGTLSVDTFSIDSATPAYYGMRLSGVNFNIQVKDKGGNIVAASGAVWQTPNDKVKDGLNDTFSIRFTPADTNNYDVATLPVSFNSEYVTMTYDLGADIPGEEIVVNLEYGQPYSAHNIINMFLTEFRKKIDVDDTANYDPNYVSIENLTPYFDGVEITQYNTNISDVRTPQKITVTFVDKNYTVTFKDADGSVIDTQMRKYNQKLAAITNPVKDGHVFMGWKYEDVDGLGNVVTKKWDFDEDRVKGDVTLTAEWFKATLTLTGITVTPKAGGYEAIETIEDGDMEVVAHYTTDSPEMPTMDIKLKKDDATGYKIIYGSSDGKLHVNNPNITVVYAYGGVTKTERLSLTVNAKSLDGEMQANGVTFEDCVVKYDGTAKEITGVKGELPIQISDVEYEYWIGGNKIDKSQVVEIGLYTVRAIFISNDPDYTASVMEAKLTISRTGAGGDLDPDDPNNPDNPNNPDGDGNGDGGTLDEILAKIKDLPLWQLIASVISIILILIFTGKGISYASKKKENKKVMQSKYATFYASAFLGISVTNWTVIASVLMGVAVLSFVFMLIEKRGYKKSVRNLEDAKEEYERNVRDMENKRRDEDMKMMFMHMMGGQANMQGGQGQPQGFAYAGQGLGAEDIRGIVSETMTAMLPNMQQYLPQQASVNDEVIKGLLDGQKAIMEKLSQQPTVKVVEKEAVSENVSEETLEKLIRKLQPKTNDETILKIVSQSEHNDETIKQLLRNQESIMNRLQELSNTKSAEPQVIEKVVEKPVEKIVEVPVEKIVEVPVEVEKIVEKEVVKEVPIEVEKVVEKIVEIPAAKPAPKAKAVAPRLTLDEAYAKLSAKQKKFFDTIKEYALSKDKCKEKKSTYYILLGQSSVNPLVKLTIKKDCTVAMFKMEDEYMKDIRKNATSDGTKVKVKETELIVGDAQALATAKEMIDLREDQIERYNDFLKEQRSLKKR